MNFFNKKKNETLPSSALKSFLDSRKYSEKKQNQFSQDQQPEQTQMSAFKRFLNSKKQDNDLINIFARRQSEAIQQNFVMKDKLQIAAQLTKVKANHESMISQANEEIYDNTKKKFRNFSDKKYDSQQGSQSDRQHLNTAKLKSQIGKIVQKDKQKQEFNMTSCQFLQQRQMQKVKDAQRQNRIKEKTNLAVLDLREQKVAEQMKYFKFMKQCVGYLKETHENIYNHPNLTHDIVFHNSVKFLKINLEKIFLILNGVDKQDVLETLKKSLQQSYHSKNIFLILEVSKLLALFYLNQKELSKSLIQFKKIKQIAYMYGYYNISMKALKYIGQIYQDFKQYSKAKHNFLKMLEYAWKTKNLNYESLAYDLIGKQYFYLGQLDYAQEFHGKMINGYYENQKSDIRKLSSDRLNVQLKKFLLQLKVKNINLGQTQIDVQNHNYFSSCDSSLEFPQPIKQQDVATAFFDSNEPQVLARSSQKNQKIGHVEFVQKNSSNRYYMKVSKSNALMEKNSAIKISHLSMARSIDNYKILDAKSIQEQHFKINQMTEKNIDVNQILDFDIGQFKNSKTYFKFLTIVKNIKFTIDHLDTIIKRFENTTQTINKQQSYFDFK